ncbi:LysR family transcriptional regulator [Bacillus licheniformis]|jgi:DNA-binding transcriptional LysR family regulator|uniref:HTH-type transcriptional regulator CynR n=1 Tax=Bacillus licheniformis TaxID=1402 RepID=A0A5Q3BUX1_BACLI|nr:MULTISPECIES: LysR family transcriptional regulator [Bacillus]MBJ7887125.1 LysR family transcriptional regulator [Bacillaceae bacterium HSR45]MBY8348413.1 LysR family transcriptional regulator [Bacillus sp. PCH94]MDP4079949.1 LysR family transcriptional regulator [Bacillota bacterium]AKQ75330.1 transcriptional regulator [Bacillus licheniformis WX-02]AMR12379.1 LysR family transcriptional regulator [Bacillus licheniformis]
MDIRHLTYFLEVARLKSFTKAAQSLYISQPTISKMIKNLEEELGIELFYRRGRQIELTDAGQSMYVQAQEITKSFQNLTSELNDLMDVKKGHVRIGLPPMIGSGFFPKVIGDFRDKYPNVTFQLVEHGSVKVQEGVEDGSLDIGVVVLPAKEEIFHSFTIVKEDLMLIVHPSHRFADAEEIELRQLSEEPFIFFREDFVLHERIITACLKAGFQPNVIYETSQWDFISEMVSANLGIGLLPERICRDLDPERVRIIPLVRPAIPWHVAVIWRKDRYLSFAARAWIDHTKSYIWSENSKTERNAGE